MVLLLPVIIGTALGLIEGATIQYYASKYDHIDVDTILNNRRMVNYYAACMLSKGPCPPEGIEFKRILPEALRTNCLRCTEKQKTVTLRAIRRLKKEYPKVWAQLSEQWDPDGTYIEKFESTFGGKQTQAAASQQTIQLANRFSEDADKDKGIENAISEIFSTNSTTSSPSTTNSAITNPPSTLSTSSRTTPKISTAATTNKPNINTITVTAAKPTKKPRPGLGAGFQATVSLGPQLVGEFVRGLGALGTRVVETGAEIAGVVLKNIVNMVKSIEKVISEIAQQKLEFISRFLTG